MNAELLTTHVHRDALALGFSAVGICRASEPPGLSRFQDWLAAGYAGQMQYLPERADAYSHPRHVLAGVQSVVMLAWSYRTEEPQPLATGQGRVSRYAWGEDYHDLIRERLHLLADRFRERVPSAAARGIIDTAPLLEREYAQLAGLGWIGKNTMLISPRLGSWFFLAALLVDQPLVYDQPFTADHCGTCRACLDACPTNAFTGPYQLDARRCISYLTIELREPVEPELRAGMGDWLFGCDVCQDVCPWNRMSPTSLEPRLAPAADSNPMELAALFELDDASFRQRFRNTPLWRPRRRGMLRNAALVLGNQRSDSALPALRRGLEDDEILVRGACAWALGQLASPLAAKALIARQLIESDAGVRGEIDRALKQDG